MEIITSLPEFLKLRNSLTGNVGLVPTMGALHQGHLALVETAQKENDTIIATIFVNPLQFGANEDLDSYPRDLENDSKKLESAGADYVFVPTPDMMYPAGYQTYVEVGEITDRLEGRSRPGHFKGVTTVVAKLFNIIRPHRAYFGQKDAQQIAVIRRMVHDLNFQIDIIPVPTVRESDGLAMSSRNQYLNQSERTAASVINKSLKQAIIGYNNGIRNPEQLRQIIAQTIEAEPLAKLEYVSIADASTLIELDEVIDSPMLASLTVRIGKARLLDNCLLPVELNTLVGLKDSLGYIS